jgi:hypothetical protein
LVHAVITIWRKAEQNADVFRVGVINQLAQKIALDVVVITVVLPSDRIRFRPECTAHPEDHRVAAILGDAIDDVLPLGKVVLGHPAEGEVIAAVSEGGVGAAGG